MDAQLKSNLTSNKHWLRFLYMVFFMICLQVASFVMWVLVCLQFLISLVNGLDNSNLRRFGETLSEYIYRTLRFLTYNSQEKPFPFSDWPEAKEDEPLEGEVEVARPERQDSNATNEDNLN